MADDNSVYFDGSGYEKYLYSNENIYLDDLDKYPCIEDAEGTPEEKWRELTYIHRDDIRTFYYYKVTKDSPLLLTDKATEVRNLVYLNLGIPDDIRTTNYSLKVFLATKKISFRLLVVGYVEVHPKSTTLIHNRYWRDEDFINDLLPCVRKEPAAIKCGVSAVWIKSRYRKLGIATTLLNLVKKHMFEEELTWTEIAFAHITFTGQRFVQNFFRKQMDKERDSLAAKPEENQPVLKTDSDS